MWSRDNRVQQKLSQIRLFPKGPIGVDVDFVCAGPPGVCSAGLCCYELNFLFCAAFTAIIADLKCINIKCCIIIYIYICVFQLFSSTFSNQNNLENGSHLFCWCFQLCCIFQVETSSSFQRPPLTSPVRSSWAQHGQNARLDGWHWDGDNRVAWVTHGFLVPRL